MSEVCKGHLNWLSSVEVNEGPGYVANYWVTAKAMTRIGSRQPDDSLTDTAYHVLKTLEFTSLCNEEDDFNIAKNAIKTACRPWIKHLEKLDVRACSAWPHAHRVGTNVFRLDDHIWIWKALKTIEDLALLPRGKDDKFLLGSSREVQQQILRRFTTENETLKKRMLAVTRSSRETRFLFHAHDTALFYGYDWGFLLQQTPFREMWENTLEAQTLHVDNQNTFWSSTLRYGLAVIMGSRGWSINKQSPSDLTKSCLRSILQGTPLNGICAGQLNEITKEPIPFSGEDDSVDYFNVSFEVSYILLANAISIGTIYNGQSGLSHVEANQTSKRQSVPLHLRGGDSRKQSEGRKAQPKRQKVLSEEAGFGFMKKTIPFGRLFDLTSVVEIDEEWLYNYPSFLLNEAIVTDKDITKMLSSLIDQAADRDTGERVIVKGAKEARERLDNGGKWFEEDDVLRSVLADVPKSKKHEKQQRLERLRYGFQSGPPIYERDNHTLSTSLLRPRNAANAKKRFLWHPNANTNTALICYFGSSEVEKPGISQFFDRHWHNDIYFFDEATMTMNTWETELHLSFYRLLGAQEFPFRNTPISSKNPFPNEPGRITKTSMGFRFFGDFFDRYWTCHFIEDIQSLRSDMRDKKEPRGYEFLREPRLPDSDQEQSWRQRKVTELYLFERILNTLVKCTQEILDKIREDLGVQRGPGHSTFANLSSEDYFLSRIQWNELQSVLQEVDESLEDVKLEISKWETREKDRGQERPRWTRNDERKYGGIITKVLGLTKKEIQNFHGIHASVRSLKENLIRRQEQTRQDLSLRGSEDIRHITYVTVVFLPLGFVSSILSMNGNPGSELVGSLVVCATAALLITIFALFNAKTLGHIAYKGFAIIESYSSSKMERSVLVQGNEGAKKPTDEEAPKEEPSNLPVQRFPNPTKDFSYVPRTPGTVISPRFWFLVVYTILELPARRVAMAYHVLVNGKLYTFTGCLHAILGVFCVPFCFIMWAVQVVGCNAVDLLGVLFG